MSEKRAKKVAKRKARKEAKKPRKHKQLWGVLDTKDNLWLGDDKGPKLFEDEMLAKISARMADVQLGQPAGRSQAVPFDSARRKVDELPVRMDALKALQLLEEGRVL